MILVYDIFGNLISEYYPDGTNIRDWLKIEALIPLYDFYLLLLRDIHHGAVIGIGALRKDDQDVDWLISKRKRRMMPDPGP